MLEGFHDAFGKIFGKPLANWAQLALIYLLFLSEVITMVIIGLGKEKIEYSEKKNLSDHFNFKTIKILVKSNL